MRDLDVRQAVKRALEQQHQGDDDTRIVEEMGIWSGSVRVDVAVINGELQGYELKSEKDTLNRLPAQRDLYSRVFDRVTLVSAEKHLEKASALIPDWWGLCAARADSSGNVSLSFIRAPNRNPCLEPMQIARLLWRSEALEILLERELAQGVRSKPVEILCRRLAEALPIDELRAEVRSALKRRVGWLRKSLCDQSEVSVHANRNPGCTTPC